MDVVWTTTTGPMGTLRLFADEVGLCGLYFEEHRPAPPARLAGARRDPSRFGAMIEQLDAYLAGARLTFAIELSLSGTAFQRSVWEALRRIPYGHTISYGELARWAGHPAAIRAAGAANARNPIGIIVPCHRVLGTAGALTGYAGGLARKQLLLDLERGTAGSRTDRPPTSEAGRTPT